MLGTKDAAKLKADMDRDGYVVVRNFLGPEKIAEVKREFERFLRDAVGGRGNHRSQLTDSPLLWLDPQDSASHQRLRPNRGHRHPERAEPRIPPDADKLDARLGH